MIPRAFTTDPEVIDQAHDAVAAVLRCCGPWPPSSSRSTGSSSAPATRATWPSRWSSRFVVFLPLVLTADTVAAVWVALNVLMLARLATLGARFARGRWALVGAHA